MSTITALRTFKTMGFGLEPILIISYNCSGLMLDKTIYAGLSFFLAAPLSNIFDNLLKYNLL